MLISALVQDTFIDLFSEKIGKIDAAIESVGVVWTGHDGADFTLETIDLIGTSFNCQALLNAHNKTREWSITIAEKGANGQWCARYSLSVTYKNGVLDTLTEE